MPLRLNPRYQARVLLYSDIDARHTRSGAWASQWGQNFEGPGLTQVVICSVPDEQNIQLFGLDQRSNVVFDSGHATLDDAKLYAELEFPQLTSTWLAPD